MTETSSIALMFEPGQVTELRAFMPADARGVSDKWSGYFDKVDELLSTARTLDRQGATGIYFVPNPVNPSLLARSKNRARIIKRDPCTTNEDIVRRCWLLLDFDPKRPSGISATDDEKECARQRMRDAANWLQGMGFPEPILGDSGNGFHLLYRIDLPPDSDLCERVTRAVSERFTDENVSIDRAVHNAARIWKLYGTTARKGDDTPERPHRKSSILYVPDEIVPTPTAMLEAVASEVDEPENIGMPVNGHGDGPPIEEEIPHVLSFLPDRLPYATENQKGYPWPVAIAGVLDKAGSAVLAESYLNARWPEERQGEYAEKLANPLSRVGWGSVVNMAKEHGYDASGYYKEWFRANGQSTTSDERIRISGPERRGFATSDNEQNNDTLAAWIDGDAELSNDEAIQALLALSPFQYDQIRKKAADRLECRVSTLDEELKRHGDEEEESTIFEEPDPWPEPVDGAELLDEIKTTLQQYVAFTDEAATLCVLWVIHTYALEAGEASPILAITSPEKRCGKTTLLSLLSAIVYRPAGGSAFTRAAIYRVVEKYHPTLLVDEADTFLGSSDNRELRGVINSGHTRRMGTCGYALATTTSRHASPPGRRRR